MEESPTESPETTPAVETSPSASPETPPADDAPTYMEAEWAGLPQYLCTACGHQTWDLDTMQVHQERMHAGRMQPLTVERPTAPEETGAVGTAPVPEESPTEQTAEDAEAPAETAPSPAPAGE